MKHQNCPVEGISGEGAGLANSFYLRWVISRLALVFFIGLPAQVGAQSINDLLRIIIPPATQSPPPVYRAPPPPVYEPPTQPRPVYRAPQPTQPAPAPAPRPQLSKAEVAQMQQMLTELGHDAGPADGAAGPKTMAALNAFQREFGLTISNSPNQQTLKTLRAVHSRSAGASINPPVADDTTIAATDISASDTQPPPQTGNNARTATRARPHKQQTPQAPASRLKDSGQCERVVVWANRLEDEYPFPGPAYKNTLVSIEITLPLFTDPHFLPVVNQTFTDLTADERARLGRDIQVCLRAANLDTSTRARKDRHLRSILTSAHKSQQITEFVTTARANQAWRESTLKKLQVQGPSTQTYNEIIEFTQELATRNIDMWPSEQAALAEAIDNARRQSAESALLSQVEALLDATTSPDTLRKLDAQLKPSQLWKDNTAEVAQRETLRLEQKREHIFSELIKQEDKNLENQGAGLEALAWGREWERNFQTTYASFESHPSFIAVQEKYRRSREENLRHARNDLLKIIKNTPTIETLEQDAEKYLDKQLDTTSEAGRAVFTALDEKMAELKIAAEYAAAALNYSSRENELMAVPGKPPVIVPKTYSEPDEEEIRLAVMRDITAGGGRMLSTTAVEIGVPPFDQLMPIRLDASKVEKDTCKPMTDPHAYMCSFRLYLKVSFPPQSVEFIRLGGRNEFFENLLVKFVSSINKATPGLKAHVFVLTSNGWRSPTVRQESIDAALQTYADTFSGWPECRLVQVGNQFRCD